MNKKLFTILNADNKYFRNRKSRKSRISRIKQKTKNKFDRKARDRFLNY